MTTSTGIASRPIARSGKCHVDPKCVRPCRLDRKLDHDSSGRERCHAGNCWHEITIPDYRKRP